MRADSHPIKDTLSFPEQKAKNSPREKGPRPLISSRREKGPRPLIFWSGKKGTGTFFASVFWVWMLCFSLRSAVWAGVALPLEGYCRPGRFFPVRVDGADAGRTLSFLEEGCLGCQLDAGAGGSRIVPMLAIGTPRELKWDGGSVALRSLRDDERLVACTSDQIEPSLFPDARMIAIRLDPTDLLPGPPAAWESLDAVLLDSPMFGRITDAQRSVLLAGGVVLAARGEMPDQRWPWRRVGSLWILSVPIVGPTDQLVDDSVYAPTFAWTPGWSPQVRGQVIGIAAMLVLCTGAILLLRRNRWTAGAVIFLALLTTGGVIGWRRSLGSVDRAGGDVLVSGEGLLQRDSWVYERAKISSAETVPWTGWTHPVFASSTGMIRADMRIHIGANDEMSFVFQANAGHTIAFVRREVQPAAMPAIACTHDSPMQDTAKAAYLGAGMKVVGEVSGMKGRWPGVVISR